MGFFNHLFYRLWMLTNTEIVARGNGAVRIGRDGAGDRFEQGGRRPDIGTRPSH